MSGQGKAVRQPQSGSRGSVRHGNGDSDHDKQREDQDTSSHTYEDVDGVKRHATSAVRTGRPGGPTQYEPDKRRTQYLMATPRLMTSSELITDAKRHNGQEDEYVHMVVYDANSGVSFSTFAQHLGEYRAGSLQMLFGECQQMALDTADVQLFADFYGVRAIRYSDVKRPCSLNINNNTSDRQDSTTQQLVPVGPGFSSHHGTYPRTTAIPSPLRTKIETKLVTTEGRKVPLQQIREQLLIAHQPFMREATDYSAMTREDLRRRRLTDLEEDVSHNETEDTLRDRLESIKETRHWMYLEDAGTLANHSYIVYTASTVVLEAHGPTASRTLQEDRPDSWFPAVKCDNFGYPNDFDFRCVAVRDKYRIGRKQWEVERLAFKTVDSHIGKLRAIFKENGRGGEWDERLGLGNPAASQQKLNIDEGETLHGCRSGCATSLHMTEASDREVMDHVGWFTRKTASHYMKIAQVIASEEVRNLHAVASGVTAWQPTKCGSSIFSPDFFRTDVNAWHQWNDMVYDEAVRRDCVKQYTEGKEWACSSSVSNEAAGDRVRQEDIITVQSDKMYSRLESSRAKEDQVEYLSFVGCGMKAIAARIMEHDANRTTRHRKLNEIRFIGERSKIRLSLCGFTGDPQ
ncbi:Protein dispatched 1 [Branchiostoma belcheri]|nr:Protein dispatched 1 [Branchiostoma belcheri]